MKNIIIVSFSFFLILSSCKNKVKLVTINENISSQKKIDSDLKTTDNPNIKNNTRDNNISISMDTINSNLIYTLNIKNKLCLKSETILKHPLDESIFHNLELDGNTIFYEYESARPVYYKTIYINKLLETIDSIETGKFDMEKSDYDIEIKKSDINICNQKLDKILD